MVPGSGTVRTSATFIRFTEVKCVWRQSDRCVLPVPQWEVSVSICKSYLWQLHLLTAEIAWQNSEEAGIHLAPPGALLDAVHIAGCFKFLTLEEVSCVIFHRKLVLSSDWSTVRVLFVISGMFSSTWNKKGVQGSPSQGCTSEIVCHFVSTNHFWVKVDEKDDANIFSTAWRSLFFFCSKHNLLYFFLLHPPRHVK